MLYLPLFLCQNCFVEYFFALADLNAVTKHILSNCELSGGHLLIVYQNAALLNQLASLLI